MRHVERLFVCPWLLSFLVAMAPAAAHASACAASTSSVATIAFDAESGPTGRSTPVEFLVSVEAPAPGDGIQIRGTGGFAVTAQAVTNGVWDIVGTFTRDGTQTVTFSFGAGTVRCSAPVNIVGIAMDLMAPSEGKLTEVTDDGIAEGWALDPHTPQKGARVEFFLDGDFSSGTPLGSTVADLAPKKVETKAHAFSGDHHFEFVIPQRYIDGAKHTLYAYVIDTCGDRATFSPETAHTALESSPLAFRVSRPAPVGTWGIANGALNGQAADPTDPSAPITVRFYLDGPPWPTGQNPLLGSVTTSPQDGNTFVMPLASAVATTPHRIYAYAVDAKSGSRLVPLDRHPHWTVRPPTYRNGTVQYLDNGSVRIGTEMLWGAAVRELGNDSDDDDSADDNLVNAFDTGREIQVSLWDGDVSYVGYDYPFDNSLSTPFGWEPNQGGDLRCHGSAVLAQSDEGGQLYAKVQPYHWIPDTLGGGPLQPVLSDVFIEQWISVVPGTNAFQIRYRIRHFGNDSHAIGNQQLPAVYVNADVSQTSRYAGALPWTSGSLLSLPITDPSFNSKTSPLPFFGEPWFSLFESSGNGVTTYVPGALPYATVNAYPSPDTSDLVFLTPFDLGPGAVFEGRVYLLVGDTASTRAEVYALHAADNAFTNTFQPIGSLDTPRAGDTLSGIVPVRGWALGPSLPGSTLQVLVDGNAVGNATYGTPRPDIPKAWPGAPTDCGYTFSLNTQGLAANGPASHTLSIQVLGEDGTSHLLRSIPVTVKQVPAE